MCREREGFLGAPGVRFPAGTSQDWGPHHSPSSANPYRLRALPNPEHLQAPSQSGDSQPVPDFMQEVALGEHRHSKHALAG